MPQSKPFGILALLVPWEHHVHALLVGQIATLIMILIGRCSNSIQFLLVLRDYLLHSFAAFLPHMKTSCSILRPCCPLNPFFQQNDVQTW